MTSPQSMLNFIAIRDHRLMRQVNRWQPPRWIRWWMICSTRGGDGWLWYTLGLIILLFGGSDRLLAVGCSGVAAGAGIPGFLGLKRGTRRAPPPPARPKPSEPISDTLARQLTTVSNKPTMAGTSVLPMSPAKLYCDNASLTP